MATFLINKWVNSFVMQLPDLIRQEAMKQPGSWPNLSKVYHYTSIQTLFSMISPDQFYIDNHPDFMRNNFKHFWATASPYMNDSKEFKHGQNIILNAIRRVKQSLDQSYHPIINLIEYAINQSDGLDVFCVCFSGKDDDLGQWRGYGDNGRGCSMGFERADMERNINGLGSWVIYSEENEEPISNEIVHILVNSLKMIRPIGSDKADDFDEEVTERLKRLLPALFLLFKNTAFKEEQEYRVIYSDAVAPSRLVLPEKEDTPHRWFRTDGVSIIPFVKLDFYNNSSAPLRSIRLGPASQFGVNPESLKSLLKCCQLSKVIVEASDIPFVPKG